MTQHGSWEPDTGPLQEHQALSHRLSSHMLFFKKDVFHFFNPRSLTPEGFLFFLVTQ